MQDMRQRHQKILSVIVKLIWDNKLTSPDSYINDLSQPAELRLWVRYHKNLVQDYCTLIAAILHRPASLDSQEEQPQESHKNGVIARTV